MQGFNMGRHRAPQNLDENLGDPNSSSSRHRQNIKKIPSTVRFEMPFAIWCSTCPKNSSQQLIGQGVRFNAEKKKVGNYYSTPIFSFRMKHAACGGWIEITTDPQTTDYLVTDGAKKRAIADDMQAALRESGVVMMTAEDEARKDAMDRLEGLQVRKREATQTATRVAELRSSRERDWKDPDALNRKMRDHFRKGRHERDDSAKTGKNLQEKFSLDGACDIVPEIESDAKHAGLIRFGTTINEEELKHLASKPLTAVFGSRPDYKPGMTQKERNKVWAQQVLANTRAAEDPWATETDFARTKKRKDKSTDIPGFVKKQKAEIGARAEPGNNGDSSRVKVTGDPVLASSNKYNTIVPPASEPQHESAIEAAKKDEPLVAYDSDSE